jgi:hypothetical protein
VTLFHVSEEPGIDCFVPRLVASAKTTIEARDAGDAGSAGIAEAVEIAEAAGEPVVWAIGDEHLRNYLVPRECPRVTFHAGSDTTPEDVDRFLGASKAVVAIEEGWLERLRSCRLYCYRLPAATFRCIDECAGYFVSREPVVPSGVDVIDDPIAELRKRGVDLRVVATLWPLRDAVMSSSLRYSIIRMRNAQPR